jgi:hypothetical protein
MLTTMRPSTAATAAMLVAYLLGLGFEAAGVLFGLWITAIIASRPVAAWLGKSPRGGGSHIIR